MSPISLLRSFATDRQLRNVDFRRFWFSSALTNFGAQITLLALPICAALLLHATPAQMGTLAAFGSLPFLLFSLPTGVLLDRSRVISAGRLNDSLIGKDAEVVRSVDAPRATRVMLGDHSRVELA